MKTNQTLIDNGFRAIRVNADEYEDGVGAGIGINYVKNGVWYTEGQALREIGIVRKATRTDEKRFNFTVEADTEQARNEAVEDALKQARETPGFSKAEVAGVYHGRYEGRSYVDVVLNVTREYETN